MSVCENFNEVYDVYANSKADLTVEHIAVLSRTLSRALKRKDFQSPRIEQNKLREVE